MNEEQRKQQAQIRNEEANIERIKNTSSEELIAKYFQMEYEPQSPDIKKRENAARRIFSFIMISLSRRICNELVKAKISHSHIWLSNE